MPRRSTYIQRLNDFWQVVPLLGLSANEIAVYMAILHLFNQARWPEQLSIDSKTIEDMCNLSRPTSYRAKRNIECSGLISRKKVSNGNGKGMSSVYHLNEIKEQSLKINTSLNVHNKVSNTALCTASKPALAKESSKIECTEQSINMRLCNPENQSTKYQYETLYSARGCISRDTHRVNIQDKDKERKYIKERNGESQNSEVKDTSAVEVIAHAPLQTHHHAAFNDNLQSCMIATKEVGSPEWAKEKLWTNLTVTGGAMRIGQRIGRPLTEADVNEFIDYLTDLGQTNLHLYGDNLTQPERVGLPELQKHLVNRLIKNARQQHNTTATDRRTAAQLREEKYGDAYRDLIERTSAGYAEELARKNDNGKP